MSEVGVFHPRADWTTYDARGGNNPFNPPKSWLKSPCDIVFVHYNGSPRVLGVPSDIAQAMRNMQAWGWQRDGAGIEYNDVIFQNGSIWEGFGKEVGAHVSVTRPGLINPATGKPMAYSYSAYGFCVYIGEPDGPAVEEPTPEAIEGLVQGIVRAVNLGRVLPNAEIKGHGSVASTSCPGEPLLASLGYIQAEVKKRLTPVPVVPGGKVDGTPYVVQVNAPYDVYPVGSVFICSPDFQTHRKVADPDELWQLQTSFAARGMAFPNPIPPIPPSWMKQYGKLLK